MSEWTNNHSLTLVATERRGSESPPYNWHPSSRLSHARLPTCGGVACCRPVDSNHRQHHPIGSPAAFRPQPKQYALHPLERTLAGLVITLLIFLPWALGGMKLWAQWIALALASLAFVVSLVPRTYDDRYHAGGNMRLYMWPKLLHFPIFWLGLIYFALIVCQILNPAWSYRSSSAGWWLEGIDYITWLPHGIETPPSVRMNGWRTMLIHGAAWLMICAIWVGITRRKSAKLITTVIALNGLAIAVIVILQRLTGTKKFLWLWDPPSTYFSASFIYKNHAGEFLCLILALCLGLAWWHMRQAERHLDKSNPGMVWTLCALLVIVGQMFTFSRAATAVGTAFLLVILLAYTVRTFFRSRGGTPPLVTAVSSLFALALLAVALTQMDTGLVVSKFERLMKQDQIYSVSMRQMGNSATLDMAKDSLIYGHGAGGFRSLFPLYQQHYPEIWIQPRWNGKAMIQTRLFWEYAHNDHAQLLAEMGLVGVTLAGLAFLFVFICAWQVNLFSLFGLLLMLGGPAMVLATAAVDFPLHNPAVLFTTGAVAALTLRWAQLSRRA